MTDAPTVRQVLHDAVDHLQEAGVDTPTLDAEVMLSKASGLSRIKFIAHPEFQPSQDVIDKFTNWVERRSRREPLPYITGEREFYALTFEVTPAVLIPRQDTEILVESIINLLKDKPSPIIADLGLGSGAIAVSIAKSLPDSFVYGTEFSHDALEVARRNAERIGVGDRVRFLQGDLFEPLNGMRFDAIVSNPPYIPSGDIDDLQPEVAKYEPRGALDGGPDGLNYYRRIAHDAPGYLKPGGILAVEIGLGQAPTVEDLFESNGFHDVRSIPDYNKIERVVLGIF